MNREDITPDFVQIPAPVLLADIPASHKLLFGYIYWFTKLRLQKCTASNETLGKLTGLKTRSVSTAISALREAGFISVSFDGDTRSKNTTRTIDSVLGFKQPSVPIKKGTPYRSDVPIKKGTGADEIATKEEYIKRNIKEYGKNDCGKAGENLAPRLNPRTGVPYPPERKNHRGKPSPTLEKMRETIRSGGIRSLATHRREESD